MGSQKGSYILIIAGLILCGVAILMVFLNIQVIIASLPYSAGLAFLITGLIIIVVSLATLESRRSTRNVLVAVALGTGFLLGYLLWCNITFTIPERIKYDLYKDLILVILASSTIIIALLGYSAYRVLEKTIESRVDKIANNIFLKTMCGAIARIGFAWWKRYTTSQNVIDLEQAIDLTKVAYEKYAINLDEIDKANKDLICRIKNNLAYYWAEYWRIGKADESQRLSAIIYATDIFNKKGECSLELAGNIVDTYEFVQRVTSKKKKSSKKS
jgi:hypothetical protein